MTNAGRVIVVGDLIHDLLAKFDGPVALGTDTFTRIDARPGGSGANAAAWLGHLGVETHLLARAGDDVFGRYLVGELERGGVTPHVSYDAALETGKVFVLVDGAGERTMITSRGASENLNPNDLPEALFQRETHLHLSGYTFSGGTRRETAHRALHFARKANMTVSIDPSSVPLLNDIGPENFLRWTSGADICLPNREEGALLAGTKDPDGIADALVRHYPTVVLKLGADGALLADANGTRVHTPAASATVVDTTGAGDALCAGFLAAWLGGAGSYEALKSGVNIASRVVGWLGGRPEV